MFIGNACQCVVNCFYTAGSQIAVRVESIEVRTEGSMFPCSLFRSADSAVCGRTGYGYDIETVLHRLERFVRKQCFACHGCIFIESFHFGFRISFGQDCHIDTLFFVSAFQQIFVWGDVCESFFMYQNIIGPDDMLQVCAYFVFVVAQRDFYFRWFYRVGQEISILKSFGYFFSFVCLQPFLEQ